MERELGGNIRLIGFELDESELIVAKKMVGNYATKIRHIRPYEEIRVELKIHEKQNKQDFEIKVHVLFDGFDVVSEYRDENPYNAIDKVMKKVLEETEHKVGKLENERQKS